MRASSVKLRMKRSSFAKRGLMRLSAKIFSKPAMPTVLARYTSAMPPWAIISRIWYFPSCLRLSPKLLGVYIAAVSDASTAGALERRLGYEFADSVLLQRARAHRSFANESRDPGEQDNETLEFLGDAALDLVVGEWLMQRFPAWREGQLSQTRAEIVREDGLAKVARAIDIGPFLRVGKGEEASGGRDKDSLLADFLEALIGAIYLDGGIVAARAFVHAHFASEVPEESLETTDFKTRLQELAQTRWKDTPVYELVHESGPPHERVFQSRVMIEGREHARGEGRTKKGAEQSAARKAFDTFTTES